ncbi:hypothetical protein RHSIM_Rhsim06G0040200 [Rhododendron simsii]|uniref:Cytochrome P450 n=1 Tax=Rhododendron simsii TaxID=118357 RepID=A0A834LMM4_RHOSS|nr:hypothetical protein RHSIM_Rhsim06G0040200 [Rhododendron simsii]
MEFLLPSPIILIPSIFIFFLYLCCICRKTTTTTNKKVPPEAGGRRPLIGHLPLLHGHMGRLLGALADKHGPIFTIRLGVHRVLVVSKPEIAKECLSGVNDNAFPNRPKSIAIDHLSYNYANFALSPYGPYWREMRKITVLELLSNHRLAMRSHVCESEVKNSVKEVNNKWVKEGSCLVEMKRWMEDITLKLTAGVIAGNGRINVDDGFWEVFKPFFDLMGTFTVADAIPFFRWFDFRGYEKEVKKTAKKMDDLLQEWLNEHKRRKKSDDQVAEAEKDFMDVMLEILDCGTNKILNFDADTINKATCVFTLASLIHAFEIAMPSNEPIDMTESLRFNNVKEMPLQVLLTPRLPSEVYGCL